MFSHDRRYRSTSHLPDDNVNNADLNGVSSHGVIFNNFPSSGRDRNLHVDVYTRHHYSDLYKNRQGRYQHARDDSSIGQVDSGSPHHDSFPFGRGMSRYASTSQLPSQTRVPYGDTTRLPQRTKWLAYAKAIKPRKPREGNLTKSSSVDNIDVIDKYPRLQQSQFYQSLHKKYPMAFHRRVTNEPVKSRRHSRRLFNSGLRVHFEDDESYADDNRSICSEMPASHYEREIRNRISQGRASIPDFLDRECRTSPTPSMASDLSVKERLDATSAQLHRLLYDSSPFLNRNYYRQNYDSHETMTTPRSHDSRNTSFSSEVQSHNDSVSPPPYDHHSHRHTSDSGLNGYSSSLSVNVSQEEQIRALQRELSLKDQEIQNYRMKLQITDIPHGQKNSKNVTKTFESMHWPMFSPDSPPDSAIDVDSVQSVERQEAYVDDATLDAMIPIDAHITEAMDINRFSLENVFVNGVSDLGEKSLTVDKVEISQLSNDSQATTIAVKDSDEDSGIVHIAQDHTEQQERHSLSEDSDENKVTPTPEDEREGQTTPTPDSLFTTQSAAPTDRMKFQLLEASSEVSQQVDDVCITEELALSLNVQQPNARVHFDDEVDDSDPRFGIQKVPSFTEKEKEIRNRYMKKKRYNVRNCLTTRNESKLNRILPQSENLPSVLCTPRAKDLEQGLNDHYKISGKHCMLNTRQISTVGAKKMASESDMRNVGIQHSTNLQSLDIHHSRQLSSSSSDVSASTLVGSQLTLNGTLPLIDTIEDSEFPKTSEPLHHKRFHIRKFLQPKKKGQYKPSNEEENFPVDIQAMMRHQFVSMPDLTQQCEHHDSVQYENVTQKSRSVADLLEDLQNSYSVDNLDLHSDVNSSKQIDGAIHEADNDQVVQLNNVSTNQNNDQTQRNSNMCNYGNTYFEHKEGSTSQQESPMAATQCVRDHDDDGDSASVFIDTPLDKENITNIEIKVEYCSDVENSTQLTTTTERSGTTSNGSCDLSNKGSIEGQRSNELHGARPQDMQHRNVVCNELLKEVAVNQEEANNTDHLVGDTEHKHVYAKVQDDTVIRGKKNKVLLSKQLSASSPDILEMSDEIQAIEEERPTPKNSGKRNVENSNLQKCKDLSQSRQSISDRVKKSAKNKFTAIFKKSASIDKGINKAGLEETPKEKKSKKGLKMPKIKNAPTLKGLFGKKKPKESSQAKNTKEEEQSQLKGRPVHLDSCNSLESLDSSLQVKPTPSSLKDFNSDGTQIIEIKKPEFGPIGIFIARGNSQFQHGIFVSRFSDEQADVRFAGILCVGDEILEINGFNVRELALDDVYDIMATKDVLKVKIMPLLARKDI